MTDYDTLIVGGGPAGLAAAVTSARAGWRTAVLIPGGPGGPLLTIEKIEDFPGFPEPVAGFELCPALMEQAMAAGADLRPETLESLQRDGDAWTATTDAGSVSARAVIVATGTTDQPLGVPLEQELTGSGVAHCASCDAPLLRGKTAVVVGTNDYALQEALTLVEHLDHVIVLDEAPAVARTTQKVYLERAEAAPNLEFRFGVAVEAIIGDSRVSGVRVRDVASGETTELTVDAIFPFVGRVPATAPFADLLELDDSGRIVTDASLLTSAPAVFAAGDARAGSSGRAAGATGEGVAAAVAAGALLSAQAAPAGA